jgi:tetratricopeptide (TPR) repeat protein
VSPRVINNRYEVVRSLGRGGTGEVFLVEDRSGGGRHLALKVLDRVRTGDRAGEHLRHEFTLLAHLSHPNLVEVYDFGIDEAEGTPFFTEEYVEGSDLLSVAPSLAPEDLLEVFVQILRGLEYLHSRGFVHRDLKPQNLLVRTGGSPEAKILDLSLAETAGGRGGRDAGVKGSVHYIAPEVLRGADVDHRADIYSLGVTIFHIIEGHLPFDGGSTRMILKGHLEREIPSVTRPPFEFLSRTILRMTAKNPALRFPTADSVIEAINADAGTSFALETEATTLSYVRTAGLVGRKSALSALSGALRKPGKGEEARAVFFLEGGRGTGKTRLLREFRHIVQTHNVRFLDGNVPRPPHTPYWGVQGVLENILTLIGPSSKLLEGFEQSLARLAPRLLNHGAEGPPHPMPDWGSRIRLHSEISKFILAASARYPLCLGFDDFEKADRGTFELLGALVRSLQEHLRTLIVRPPGEWLPPLIVVIAYDPEKVSRKRLEIMASFFQDSFCRKIELGNLSRQSTSRLIEAALPGARTPRGFRQKVFALTKGNPGLVLSTLEVLGESGSIVHADKGWQVLPDFAEKLSLSPDTTSVLAKRFAALPGAARVGLRVLSQGAASLSGPVFAAVMERLDQDAYLALDVLLSEKVVTRFRRRGAVQYTLSDPAVAEATRDIADGPPDRDLHRILGEEIERHVKDPGYDTVARLGHHFRVAGEFDKALDYTRRAADRFAAMGSFRTALRQYSAALALTEEGDMEDPVRIDLLFLRAGVHRVLGRHAQALEDLEGALRIAEENRSTPRVTQALTLLAELNLEWGKFFFTDVLGSRALDLARESGDRENLLLSEKILGRLALRRGEYDRAIEKLGRAEELARGLGLDEETADVLMEAAQAEQKLGRPDEALGRFREALALFKKVRASKGISRCLAGIGNIHFLLGDYDEALTQYRRALRKDSDSGDIAGMITVNYRIGNILTQIGLYPAARKYFQASLALSRTFDLPSETALNTQGLGFLDMVEGRLGSALRNFGRSLELYQSIGEGSGVHWAGNGVGAVYMRLNRLERAEQVLGNIARTTDETGEIRVFADVTMNLASVALRRGDLDEAERRAHRAVEEARRGSLRDFEANFHQVRGEILLRRGRHDEAVEALERARDLAASMRMEPGEAEARIALGQVLLAVGEAREAIAAAQKGLALAEKENYNELMVRGCVTSAEAEIKLENYDRAAFFFRRALEQVHVTLSDINEEDRRAYMSDKRDIFERAEWLLRKVQRRNPPS